MAKSEISSQYLITTFIQFYAPFQLASHVECLFSSVSDIKVVLNNGGPDAYQPDVYGDSIVVERKLSRSSNSGDYKIKTASMRLMSTKKSDLTRILDHFNIQVENPVAILNQETSKNFLYSKNPGEVYQVNLISQEKLRNSTLLPTSL